MRFVCPRCTVKLKVPTAKVPPKGAWVTCPRCSEHFFLNPSFNKEFHYADQLNKNASGPVVSGTDKLAGIARSKIAQKLIDKLRLNKGLPPLDQRDTEFDPSMITLYPEVINSPWGGVKFIIAAFLIISLSLAVFFLKVTRNRNIEESQYSAPVERKDDFEKEHTMLSSIISLRQNNWHKGSFKTTINYSSPESELFKYYMNRLAANACGAISSVTIKSSDPTVGIKLLADCIDKDGFKVEMDIYWPENTAIISFPQFRAAEELDLFPAD